MAKSRFVQIAAILLFIGALVAILYFFRLSPKARKAAALARAERYFRAGDLDRAALEYTALVRADSRNAQIFERLAAIKLRQGLFAQAIPALFQVRQLVPQDIANRVKLSGALVVALEYSAARKEASDVLAEEPGNGDAMRILAETAFTPLEMQEVRNRLAALPQRQPAHDQASAILLLRERKMDEAEKILVAALAADPALYRARLNLADVFFFRKDREKGLAETKAGSAAAPIRTQERMRYAELLARFGQPAEAGKEVEVLLAESPDYVPLWILRGQILLALGQHTEADAALANVFSRDPASYEGRMLQAQIQSAKGDVPAAIAALERVTKEYPNAPMAKLVLARTLAFSNREAEAIPLLQQAIALNPKFTEAKSLLAELRLRAGDAEGAAEMLTSLIRERTGLGREDELLAIAYRSMRRFDDAVAIYRKFTAAAPKNPSTHSALARALREQGKLAEAAQSYEQALQAGGDSLALTSELVGLDLARSDIESAERRVKALDANLLATSGGKILQARILGARKQWPEGEKLLLETIQAEPESNGAYQLLVGLYLETGRLKDALSQAEERAKRQPDDIGNLLLLANLHERLKQYAEARTVYETVLAKRADSIRALNNLAYLLSERFGEFAKAVELARSARNYLPNDPSVADTLGWVLYRKGDYDASLALLRESVARFAERDEVPAEVNYHAGFANAAMGNVQAARDALTKAMQSSQDFEGKARIEPYLRALTASAGGQGGDVTQLEALAKDYPQDPFIQLRLAEEFERQGKAADAEAAYQRALSLNPKFALATAQLARLLAPRDPARAMDLARKARDLAPSNNEIAGILGGVAFRSGDLPWAFTLLQQSASDAAATAQDIFRFAEAAYRLGKMRDALQALERASRGEGAGRDSAVQFQRMIALGGQPALSADEEAEIGRVLASNPGLLPARVATVHISERKGDWAGVKAGSEAILKSEPGFPVAQIYLAEALLNGNDLAAAEDLALAARKSMPDDPRTARVLGMIHLRGKQYSRAVDLLGEADRAGSLTPEGVFHLGVAYFELPNRKAAEAALNRAIAAGLKEPHLAEAQRLLAALK